MTGKIKSEPEGEDGHKLGECKKCKKSIVWIKTRKGKWIPVDNNDEYIWVVADNGFVVYGRQSHWDFCDMKNERDEELDAPRDDGHITDSGNTSTEEKAEAGQSKQYDEDIPF